MIAISETPVSSVPADAFGWAEGIAYSSDGQTLAVAELEGHKVSFLFERRVPLAELSGRHIVAPHAVAFSGDDAVLAVANRGNATVTLHERTGTRTYSNEPYRILRRPDGIGTTAVCFEPGSDSVIVVNHSGSVTCFTPDGSVAWELTGEACGFSMPDGLTLSPDGALLAVANNKSHEVTLHARTGNGYRRSPLARLRGLRHPHSLAFTPDSAKLIVTNSGGPNISVFRRQEGVWQTHPVMEWPACPYETFLVAHYEAFVASGRTLACEGGPKGLALHGERIAWSGPGFGVREHTIEVRRW